MPIRHPRPACRLPDIWLVTDARNDDRLERELKRLPRGSGLIFRHYHLDPGERRARWQELARLARGRGHLVALSWTSDGARRWRPDAAYGPPEKLAKGPNVLRLVTAHSLREIAMAHRARANAILLSPVFPTRSHAGSKALGPVRFRLLAARAQVPVIALGGMFQDRARAMRWKKWAAIDGI
jgi:thiamine-phosphate pyrophosphorylase